MSLKIAIQKSGRLYESSVNLLKKCGLTIDTSRGRLATPAQGFDAEIYFLRNSDIPTYLQDGVVDAAIIGDNVLVEAEVEVERVIALGFSKCRLSLGVPRGSSTNIEDYQNKRIATSYPVTLSRYLSSKGIKADIHTISGSVEIAPNIGLADAICDIVSTGSTLVKNGLQEAEVILRSEAVLAANKEALITKKQLLGDLLLRVESVVQAEKKKYILFNIPTENIAQVSRVLPVLRSPTVMPLIEEGWSSVHTVIDEKDFWQSIDALKKCGAEGLLVLTIDNMIK